MTSIKAYALLWICAIFTIAHSQDLHINPPGKGAGFVKIDSRPVAQSDVAYPNSCKIVIADILINDTPHALASLLKYSDNKTGYKMLNIGESDVLDIILGFTPQYLQNILKFEYSINGQNWFPIDPVRPRILVYHLSPGQYYISIRAVRNNKQIVSSTVIPLDVKGPWWKTWWAFAAYCTIASLIVIVYYQYRLRQVRLSQQLALEKLAALNHKVAANLQLDFISGVSHEFRTSLTLILNTIDRIKSKGHFEDIRQLDKIEINVQRLKKLANELTNVNKLEKEGFKLMVSPCNVIPFVYKTVQLFEELAERNHINLTFETKIESALVWFNKDQLEKVLFNLLSNAFKFTPPDGKIVVCVDTTGDSSSAEAVTITIKDSGTGIEEDDLDKVFNINYSCKPINSCGFESTGIGLHLCKKLIELHHGKIWVRSKKGSGSAFTIVLYKGTEHFEKDQLLRSKPQAANMRSPLSAHKNGSTATDKSDKIMVVEDNKEIREYIAEVLSSHYTVLQAKSGVDGIEAIKNHLPDLIITDLSMPGKDGNDLILEIRKDEITSHIPIIVLTAFTSDEVKAEVFAAGADMYLTKPSDKSVLLASVENLLHSRANLRKIFSHSLTDMEEIAQKSPDSDLLRRAIAIVDKHMSDPDFDVTALAAKLKVSRSFLYLKFPTITSYSPKDFIHIMRVRKGAKLLKSGKYNINEASEEIGYNNVKNFRKYFKDYFGAPPSSFIRNNRLKK